MSQRATRRGVDGGGSSDGGQAGFVDSVDLEGVGTPTISSSLWQWCQGGSCLNSGIACRNLAGDTARDTQRWARVVRKREKRTAVPATRAARASDDDEEGLAAGPSHTTPALPTLGMEDDEGEVLAGGISGVPDLEERDDVGAPVAPEVAEGDRGLESVRLVWRPADKPATKFERVTQRVGELRELEASMADYATTCNREYAALKLELLRLQTTLGETWQLQGTLVEARREAEEALWEILAFD
ncbi:hypothetical protein C0991_004941 [Blastosporella zonata]|nr:hypothetical protein C0991_004941 [Blastosporella zonata]